MHPRIIRRLLAGTGAALTAVALAGAPASAAAPADFQIFASDVTMLPGDSGGEFIWGYSATEITANTITFDQSDIADFASLSFSSQSNDGLYDCTTSGTLSTCTADHPYSQDEGVFALMDWTAVANDDAAPGSTGAVKIAVKLADGRSASLTVDVTIGEGVDLVALPAPKLAGKPGEEVRAPLAVTNVGDTDVTGFHLRFHLESGLQPLRRHGNCNYLTFVNDIEVSSSGSLVDCGFTGTIAAGTTVRLDDSFAFRLPGDLMAPGRQDVRVEWLPQGDYDLDTAGSDLPWERGSGAALEVVQVASPRALGVPQLDESAWDNVDHFELEVTGKQSADVVAVGDAVSADRGATVPVTVSVRNDGPAALRGSLGTWMPWTSVMIPAGTSAVAVPEDCFPAPVDGEGRHWEWDKAGEPGHERYVCRYRTMIAPGERLDFEFRLKVVDGFARSAGEVKLYLFNVESEGESKDLDTANNTAEIVITAGGGEGGGGTLPVTGVQAGLIGGVGAALLLAGGIGFVLARRRKTTFVA